MITPPEREKDQEKVKVEVSEDNPIVNRTSKNHNLREWR